MDTRIDFKCVYLKLYYHTELFHQNISIALYNYNADQYIQYIYHMIIILIILQEV